MITAHNSSYQTGEDGGELEPQRDPVVRAALRAIAEAKARGSEIVTPDHLLLGLLHEAGRYGFAIIGNLAIDVEEARQMVPPSAAPAREPKPAYSAETQRIFELAAREAREAGHGRVGLEELLLAYSGAGDGLFAGLAQLHGYSTRRWRAEIARGLGPTPDGAQRPAADGGTELLTTEEAARFLGVHYQTIRNYVRAEKLPAYRLAGERALRFRRADLLALLEPVRPADA